MPKIPRLSRKQRNAIHLGDATSEAMREIIIRFRHEYERQHPYCNWEVDGRKGLGF